MPEIIYITKFETLRKYKSEIVAARILGVDCETETERDDKKAFSPLDSKIRLLQIAVSFEKCFVFDLRHLNALHEEFDFLRKIFADDEIVKIFHNAKFDIKFLLYHFGVEFFESVYDTQIGSTIINAGFQQVRNNLADVCERFLGKRIDKTMQTSDFSQNELSDSQIRYSAVDALVLHPLRDKMNEYFSDLSLNRCALIEFDCVQSVAMLENNGFFVDSEMWLKRVEREEREKAEFAAKLHEAFRQTSNVNLFGDVEVNLDSQDEVKEALERIGCKIEDSTVAWKIKPLIKDFPIIQTLLDYRERATALSTYGRTYLEYISGVDNRIHATFKQVGATPTGRFSCENPNIQQVNTDEDYRSCFRPQSENKKLVIADYSQIELRLLAEFSQDPKLCKAFIDGVDLHQYTASLVFKKPLEQCGKGSKERRLGKDLNFGTVYDISAPRFALNTGQTVKEAEKQLKAFFTEYCILDDFLKMMAQRAIDEREARTWSGRLHKLDFDDKDLKEQSRAGRNGRNTPIQGTSADILKRALYLLSKQIHGTSAKLVNIVHDEIILECDATEAEETKERLLTAMTSAGEEVLHLVPCKVDANIADDWDKG